MVKGPTDVEKRTNPDEARRRRNALNRQRGKKMEREISKIFLGNTRGRVAFSGAGAEKGDNKIPLPNDSGYLYVECKTSELRHPQLGPGVPLRYEWFATIEKNRTAMGSKLGVLAIHFHQFSGNYIFFREDDIPLLESISGNSGYTFGGPILDYRYNKSGRPQVTDTFYRNRMLDGFRVSTGTVPNVRYDTFIARYVVCTVEDFKTLCGYPERIPL